MASRAAERVARWSEDLPPVLVREVRQALRGHYFAVVLSVAVLASALAGTLGLIRAEGTSVFATGGSASPTGGALFLAVLGGALLGVFALVPIGAHNSLAEEIDDGAFEMLRLSGLSLREIARGKLYGAAVQSALILAAALPFAALSFSMFGVGLAAILFGFAGSWLASVSFSAGALLCAAAARSRAERVALLLFLLATAGGGGAFLFLGCYLPLVQAPSVGVHAWCVFAHGGVAVCGLIAYTMVPSCLGRETGRAVAGAAR